MPGSVESQQYEFKNGAFPSRVIDLLIRRKSMLPAAVAV
jgi:hypothetical protein